MFGGWKQRRIFRIGAASFEHAEYVSARKGVWMVDYLRARRTYASDRMLGLDIYSLALRDKQFARSQHFKTQ